ncbi:protoglobin domain-containing protein [Alkalihalobacterium sp. APHAB7]|uniref:protoglobin domain-containing protein n=1 Tax=Alkalihalobacterium sp. APHAB7 TaxID=3402081 RepID=UPI003AB00DDC
MIFKYIKKAEEKDEVLEGIELKVGNHVEITRQLEMISLNEGDLIHLKRIQPFINQNIDTLVENFYKSLEEEPTLLSIINQNSSTEKLKNTLKSHISEMFDGRINEEFFKKRNRIALVHVKIGLKTKWYISAFQQLYNSILLIIKEKINSENQFQTISAVSKIFNLEQQLVLEAYELETERLETQIMQQKEKGSSDVALSAHRLASLSEETNISLQELTNNSNEILTLAKKGSESSSIAEERSIQGKEQLIKQSLNLSKINTLINQVIEDVKILKHFTKEMEEIIKLITTIADQTNLLSLNSAIEAARAGEHGRGFSVVSNEVRKLSVATKDSVNNVSGLIHNTNAQVDRFVDSLDTIMKEIEEGNLRMEDTKEQFEQIFLTMKQTKVHNKQIESETLSFITGLKGLAEAFEEVSTSSDNLSLISQSLNYSTLGD